MLKIVKNESGNATMRWHPQERDPESLRRVVCNEPSSGVAEHLWSGDAESAGASGQRPAVDEHGERCRSLPPYLRRSLKVAEVSTRDLRPALETLLGGDAVELSVTNIGRLTAVCVE